MRSFFIKKFVITFLYSLLFSVPAYTSITGTVKDTEGNPVSDAFVRFIDESNESVEFSGITNDTGHYEINILVGVEDALPKTFNLGQNYPNPFNPSTTIPFALNESGHVRLTVYNIQGQKVRTITNGFYSSGSHSLIWNGADDKGRPVGSGVYIYQLNFSNRTESKKMLLLDGGITKSPGTHTTRTQSVQKVTFQGTYKLIIECDGYKTYTITGLTLNDGDILNYTIEKSSPNTHVIQGITFATIPGGTFQMGSNYSLNEQPIHTVTVSGFEMSIYEITQGQYEEIIDSNPSHDYGVGINYPVYYVSWYDAVKFCNKLSEMAGFEKCYNDTTWQCNFSNNGFRLPTEAEWEYACRGGKNYEYGTDDGTLNIDTGNFSYGHLVDAGSYPANPYGLFDMSGNVWEWCNDWFDNYSSDEQANPTGSQTGINRIIRGGSYIFCGDLCRSASRIRSAPYNKEQDLGFRIVRRQTNQQTIQGVTLATITGGTFQMGSNYNSNEQPVHTVTVSSFNMGIYEITQGQYKAITGSNPSSNYGEGDNYPVYRVTWYDAVRFCNKLSDTAGFDRCYDETTWNCDFNRNGFRLPTEAEWEYACRAGTTTHFYTGDNLSDLGATSTDLDRAGWYWYNWGLTNDKCHEAGAKEPNSYGLYDMHGNLWEWCNDWYGDYSSSNQIDPKGAQEGPYRVKRGGSWSYNAGLCRSAYRNFNSPADMGINLGFRVVRRAE